jgi:hypothetical protein
LTKLYFIILRDLVVSVFWVDSYSFSGWLGDYRNIKA